MPSPEKRTHSTSFGRAAHSPHDKLRRGNLRNLLGPRTTYDLWHIDQTFTPNVPSTTFFWNLETPSTGGGDTAFTSLTAAYVALSPTYRATLHSLKLRHTSASVGEVARVGHERAMREAVKAEHPLVIKHPVTGSPALFVNPTIAREVVGCLPEESAHILGFLHNHVRSLDFSCRVRWEKGTVVIWDQVSCLEFFLHMCFKLLAGVFVC